jgi:hypothetical protein
MCQVLSLTYTPTGETTAYTIIINGILQPSGYYDYYFPITSTALPGQTFYFYITAGATTWDLVYINPGSAPGAPATIVGNTPLSTECPTSSAWNIFGTELLVISETVEGPPPAVIQSCLYWTNNQAISNLPAQWSPYVFPLFDLGTYSSITVGQVVTSITYDNIPNYNGAGQITVLSFVYLSTIDNTTVYFEAGPDRQIAGLILVDSTGQLLDNSSVGFNYNQGILCLGVLTTLDTLNDCYDILVWEKQCEFSKCVLEYVYSLQFGIQQCKMLDELINTRRALAILNCYDTQDIENDTMDYNNISYHDILQLLNN